MRGCFCSPGHVVGSGLALLLLLVGTTNGESAKNADKMMERLRHYARAYEQTTTWTPSELISDAGYDPELWYVRTPDQFQIGVHRIPNEGKQPVLFVHGFVMNAGCFVANMPENTLAFLMHDAGFDVWLINLRGTKSSFTNYVYDSHEPEFWNWSFLEPGLQDVSSTIDFILAKTGFPDLPIVSHSEGGATVYAMLADTPKLAEKISFHLALAPCLYLTYSTCPVLVLSDYIDFPYWFDYLNASHTPIPGPMIDWALYEMCTVLPILCETVVNWLAGWDMSNMNASRVDIYVQCVDATSVMNVDHLLQLRHTATFGYFDYGEEENLVHYNQTVPPVFPIDTVMVPTKLYYGGEDVMVSQKDVEELLIPSLNSASFVEPPTFVPSWSHADFIWSIDGELYKEMVAIVKAFS
ncbi:lysosomal acid lipase/cholesteryl ester hydrolase [Pelomyxa schiedti]|nr:lysosomal acid lipase/cholesteryl ester hydrolase [Pelomyxa schiedti]